VSPQPGPGIEASLEKVLIFSVGGCFVLWTPLFGQVLKSSVSRFRSHTRIPSSMLIISTDLSV
jgi:hypothetical protein